MVDEGSGGVRGGGFVDPEGFEFGDGGGTKTPRKVRPTLAVQRSRERRLLQPGGREKPQGEPVPWVKNLARISHHDRGE